MRANMRIKDGPLDKLFSIIIRTRANFRCERCYKSGRVECSHYHGRRKHSVRWDLENAAAFCFSCHRYMEENPSEHHEFFLKKLGQEKYDNLNLRANIPTKIDRKLMRMYLREIYKMLVLNRNYGVIARAEKSEEKDE